MILFEMSRIGKFIATESRLEVTRGWGWRDEWELLINGDRVSVWGGENILK